MGKGGIEGKWSKDPITKARVIIIRNLLSLTSAKKHRARNFERGADTKPPQRPPEYQ
ncbi:MAG: hypothetical protein WBY28_02035 [Nitrososphaeraceae archaeon]